jgi:zinc protease
MAIPTGKTAPALAFLAAVAVVLPLPRSARADERLRIPYEMFRLPNGLTVIVHEDHSVPIATVNTWYHVGSSRERPGRTGLAHFFEHLMFEGSKHVPEGVFDRTLESVGGSNNASTDEDRTNYFDDIPASALELTLFLESDRMAHLLDTLTPERVDGQRDVVKNERRESYESPPYGMADLFLAAALYPPDHPYHWPVIGSMEDLSAATREDMADFFKRYYAPGNASLVVAGDVDTKKVRELVTKWYGNIPPGPPVAPMGTRPVTLTGEKRLVYEDKVQLPRLYLRWPTPPFLSPADAALDALGGVLAGSKNARLYKRLVYDLQIAQNVAAFQSSSALASTFSVIVTARSGHDLEEMRRIVDEEIERIKQTGPTDREIERFLNMAESAFLGRLENVGGDGGKADQLNQYFVAAGNPDFFEEDLARYRALAPADIQAVAKKYLGSGRVALSVVPEGKPELGLSGSDLAR